MGRFSKAIAAAISGVVGLLAMFVPAAREVASPEFIAGLSTVIATAAVYLIPNTLGGVNVNDLADATVEAWLDEEAEPDGMPGLGLDIESAAVRGR